VHRGWGREIYIGVRTGGVIYIYMYGVYVHMHPPFTAPTRNGPPPGKAFNCTYPERPPFRVRPLTVLNGNDPPPPRRRHADRSRDLAGHACTDSLPVRPLPGATPRGTPL